MDPERDRRPGSDSALTRARRRMRPPRMLRATRAGWCFIAIIFGVGFAALNTGNNLLYLVLALMLAFLVLSGLLSEASLRGIEVERHLPRELFARTANRVVLRVRNRQKRVASFAISLEDQVDRPAGVETVGRCFALRVGPGESSDRSYAFEPEARGDLHFDRIRVSTRFPFGLFVKSAELEVAASALVYPAIVPTQLTQEQAASGQEDADPRGRIARGDDIAGLREFTPGDSLGRVHWKRSLRSGRLLVGEREGEAAGEIEILLRLAHETSTEAIEHAVSHAASEVVAHLDAGLRVGLRSPTTRFVPASGFAHRTDLLSYLARVEPETPAVDSDADARAPGRASSALDGIPAQVIDPSGTATRHPAASPAEAPR